MPESSGRYLYIVAWSVCKVQPAAWSMASHHHYSMLVRWSDLLLAFELLARPGEKCGTGVNLRRQ
jgi:hypothetical protein